MHTCNLKNTGKSPRGVPLASGGILVLNPGEEREGVEIADGDFKAMLGGPVSVVAIAPDHPASSDDADTPAMAEMRASFNEAWAGLKGDYDALKAERDAALDENKALRSRIATLEAGGGEDDDADKSAYAVQQSSPGWFVITKDGQTVTKSFRKDDVDGFDEFSEEDKAAFVEANKADD